MNEDYNFLFKDSDTDIKQKNFNWFYIVLPLLIIGWYFYPKLSINESCDNFLSTWNLVDSLENDFIALNDQTVDIWNEYVTYQIQQEYILLTAEQQKETHRDLDLYQLDTLFIKEQDVITEISNIPLTEANFHQEHIELYDVLNDVINIQIIKFSLINKNTQDSITYISQIEIYFEEWDSAYNANNSKLMEDLSYNFWEIYDIQWTEDFIDNNNEIDKYISQLNSKVDSYAELSSSYCGHTYDS